MEHMCASSGVTLFGMMAFWLSLFMASSPVTANENRGYSQ